MAALGVPGIPAAVFAAAFAGLRLVSNGRARFLWRWLQETWRKSADEDPLPQAVIVPLSRVLCMYDEPTNSANGTDAGPPCTVSDNGSPDPPPTNPPRLDERLKTEIRNKLDEEDAECDGDLRISPPIVFRPYKSDQLAATAGPTASITPSSH